MPRVPRKVPAPVVFVFALRIPRSSLTAVLLVLTLSGPLLHMASSRTGVAAGASILQTSGVNVALASNGATASASSTYSSSYPVGSTIDGDRKGLNWGAGGGWNDATNGAWPDWLEVDFPSAKTVSEIDVFTLQDNFSSP